MRKSVFGEHMPRFWEEQAPFLGQSGSVLVKSRLGLGEIGSFLGLAWGSSLTVLNTKHVLVWIFEFLGLGVTKKSQPVESWEGKILKPINFDVENWLLLR